MVDDVVPARGRATLDWMSPGPGTPSRMSLAEVGRTYRLCTPWGFLARSVRVPAGLRAFTRDEPLTALRLLLEDLDRPLSPEDVRGWLRLRGLIGEEEFAAWWVRVEAELSQHSRFEQDAEGRVRYRTEEDLEAALEGPVEAAARTFLAQSPAGRFRLFRRSSPAFLEAVLEAALRKRDIAAILLALRGQPAPPRRSGPRTR